MEIFPICDMCKKEFKMVIFYSNSRWCYNCYKGAMKETGKMMIIQEYERIMREEERQNDKTLQQL